MSSEEDPVAWLRARIGNRLYLARHAIELGNAAEWTELSTGVLVTGEPTETDTWHGTWPMGDSSLSRLMEANDPQDTIARCEAELAILDLHRWIDWDDEHYSGTGCITCDYQSRGHVDRSAPRGPTSCLTVRHLASGYKYWPGYREEDWKPAA
jgi:hypothetical protein